MIIRTYSEKGFSLVELLVVVAIIGVLAAVGVVGYQGYIDSTKRSVTQSNAKAIQQWIVNTDTVRAAHIKVNITECEFLQRSQAQVKACMSLIAATGNPFVSFKNAYDSTRRGDTMITATTTAVTANTACSTHTGVELGDILIHVASDAAVTVTPFYCVLEGTTPTLLTQTGWGVPWGD